MSAHAHADDYYREVVRGYRETMGKAAEAIVRKVREIEERGRYT